MTRSLEFVKMHSNGNDFVVIDVRNRRAQPWEKLVPRLTNRHFGIGADGVVLISRSKNANFGIRYFNADGTEDICGNALICVGKYLYEELKCRNVSFAIGTIDGIKELKLIVSRKKIESVQINLGSPRLEAKDVPVNLPWPRVIDYPLKLDKEMFKITCLSLGTPHTVIFPGEDFFSLIERQESFPLFRRWSQKIEQHPLFPYRTSVIWGRINSPVEIQIRTWERGVGETLACGTGAAAALVVACLHGWTKPKVEVVSYGGKITTEWDKANNNILITGTSELVFRGQW